MGRIVEVNGLSGKTRGVRPLMDEMRSHQILNLTVQRELDEDEGSADSALPRLVVPAALRDVNDVLATDRALGGAPTANPSLPSSAVARGSVPAAVARGGSSALAGNASAQSSLTLPIMASGSVSSRNATS